MDELPEDNNSSDSRREKGILRGQKEKEVNNL